MGLRATAIKKYEVEYGNTQGFNYDVDTLSNIISEFCEDFYNGDDGFGGNSTNEIWEIDKEQFKQMIADIEGLTEEGYNELMDRCEVKYSADYQRQTKDYVVNFFKGCLAETQEDSHYVRIGWL
jgi:hypothetical protein